MSHPFHTLDVFTNRKFAGNPLAVVLDADDLDEGQMHIIAREFNLSETIFVQSPDDGSHAAKVRIFTPMQELPFAGHPTIGCAILLAQMEYGTGDFETTITLEEKAGIVPVIVKQENGKTDATFTAPVIPSEIEQEAVPAGMIAAGIGVGESDISAPDQCGHYIGGPSFFYVALNSTGALEQAKPNGTHWQALMKTANSESFYLYVREGNQIRARMFAPDHGIAEDPATGSASAILAAPLLKCGALDEGHNVFHLKQGYEMGRPSQIGLEIDVQDRQISAIRVSGSAVRVMQGEL